MFFFLSVLPAMQPQHYDKLSSYCVVKWCLQLVSWNDIHLHRPPLDLRLPIESQVNPLCSISRHLAAIPVCFPLISILIPSDILSYENNVTSPYFLFGLGQDMLFCAYTQKMSMKPLHDRVYCFSQAYIRQCCENDQCHARFWDVIFIFVSMMTISTNILLVVSDM